MGQARAQRPLPDELLTNTIEGQINYLEERTGIYENYRAIREDMFQKINSNVLDSLRTYKDEIIELKDEFEEYRQKSRQAREKMTMEHFNSSPVLSNL